MGCASSKSNYVENSESFRRNYENELRNEAFFRVHSVHVHSFHLLAYYYQNKK